MLLLKTNSGCLYVKCGSLQAQQQKAFDELSRQFADKNVRAIAVELDPDEHSVKAKTVLCEDILEIILE